MRSFASLSRQADFARLRRRGKRVSTKSLVIYRSDALAGDTVSLVGITVSKSIGKAVIRNKLRRRLAALVNETLGQGSSTRLLIVARPGAADLAFGDLRTELASALGRA